MVVQKILILCFLLIGSINASAQEYIYEKGALRMPYREKSFHQEKVGKSALVLYLHPRSARGHDNTTQTKGKAYQQLTHYIDSVGIKAIVLAPQCEEVRHWNEYKAPIGKYLSDVVKDFLDDYIVYHQDVDSKRVYVCGESFGASGVWRLITDYPHFFAAAMPSVCSPKLKKLTKFVNLKKASKTPICVTIGEKDQIYGPTIMTPYIEELKKRNCDFKYIVLPGKTHYNACLEPFPSEGLDWMFKHAITQ